MTCYQHSTVDELRLAIAQNQAIAHAYQRKHKPVPQRLLARINDMKAELQRREDVEVSS